MRRAGIICDRGVVLICDGGLKHTLANVQRLSVQVISGDYSGQKKDSCFDFSDGLVKSKAILTRNSVWSMLPTMTDVICMLNSTGPFYFYLTTVE